MTLKPALTMQAIRNNTLENKINTLQIELLKANNKMGKKLLKGEIKVLKKIQKDYKKLLNY